MRVKRKRDDKDGREMRCYRADCGYKERYGSEYQWVYCPRDGVWKDDGVLESAKYGVTCPKCGRAGCKFV